MSRPHTRNHLANRTLQSTRTMSQNIHHTQKGHNIKRRTLNVSRRRQPRRQTLTISTPFRSLHRTLTQRPTRITQLRTKSHIISPRQRHQPRHLHRRNITSTHFSRRRNVTSQSTNQRNITNTTILSLSPRLRLTTHLLNHTTRRSHLLRINQHKPTRLIPTALINQASRQAHNHSHTKTNNQQRITILTSLLIKAKLHRQQHLPLSMNILTQHTNFKIIMLITTHTRRHLLRRQQMRITRHTNLSITRQPPSPRLNQVLNNHQRPMITLTASIIRPIRLQNISINSLITTRTKRTIRTSHTTSLIRKRLPQNTRILRQHITNNTRANLTQVININRSMTNDPTQHTITTRRITRPSITHNINIRQLLPLLRLLNITNTTNHRQKRLMILFIHHQRRQGPSLSVNLTNSNRLNHNHMISHTQHIIMNLPHHSMSQINQVRIRHRPPINTNNHNQQNQINLRPSNRTNRQLPIIRTSSPTTSHNINHYSRTRPTRRRNGHSPGTSNTNQEISTIHLTRHSRL